MSCLDRDVKWPRECDQSLDACERGSVTHSIAMQCSAVQCSALMCKIAQWGYIANNLKHLEWVLLHGHFSVLSTCMLLYVLSTSP